MPISESVLDALKAEHGEVYVLRSRSGDEVVARGPTRSEYKRFKSNVNEPSKRTMAIEVLFLQCLLHPSREEFDALLERKPALVDVFGSELLHIAGLDDGAEVSKR